MILSNYGIELSDTYTREYLKQSAYEGNAHARITYSFHLSENDKE